MNQTTSFGRTILGAAMVVLSVLSAHTAVGQETVVYNFRASGATDGASPYEGLIMDAKGNLFGTTLSGGLGYGTVFELSPVAGGGWTEKVLYSFTGGSSTTGDGNTPRGTLVMDSKGNLYGTTLFGGEGNNGTAYELSPASDGSWTEKVLFRFGSRHDEDAGLPVGNLVFDAQGNLYGVSVYGGINTNPATGLDCGTFFELTPSANGTWTEQVLYSFGATATDGFNPRGGVAIDAAGNVYGTTSLGGSYSDLTTYGGTVFELTPGTNGSATEKILHEFNPGDGDGSFPMANLILDGGGNVYGTTVKGGDMDAGTVFELSPVAAGPWTENVFKFTPKNVSGVSASGYGSTAGLTLDSSGNLYGTTVSGGAGAAGTTFELMPHGGTWTETVLHSFPAAANDGQNPHGAVVFDAKGNLYGTTSVGGTKGNGTIFKIQMASETVTALAARTPAGLVAGKPITLTATVVAMDGSGTPTGTVTFAAPSGGSVTVPLDQTGTAVYKGVVPAVGTYAVFSRYNGSPGMAGSTSATITGTVTSH